MNTTIEFNKNENTTTTDATTTPWTSQKQTKFEDRVLKPEYATRRFRFQTGWNWFRILPGLQSSSHGWMMGVHAIDQESGRFAHPKTLKGKGERCVFDLAYTWCKEHHPEALYSKANKNGARLLTDPLSLCWIVTEENGRSVLRLLQLSGYDGSRGGNPGLGYQLWKAAREQDEHGKVRTDAIDPNAGCLVGIEKIQPKGAKFPTYNIRVGRNPSPVADHIAKLDPEELRALCPLENTIELLSEEEQWQWLERVIAPETVGKIRADLNRAPFIKEKPLQAAA